MADKSPQPSIKDSASKLFLAEIYQDLKKIQRSSTDLVSELEVVLKKIRERKDKIG